ncbi:MAG TPA: TolC family protein [Bacteroidales bacterium]|nr:TolC family protein [Bacteroidales bacterium]
MKKVYFFSAVAALLISFIQANAQQVRQLTLDEVIKIAEEQSPNAFIAKHRFRASYWQYRTFEAEYRPSLTLTGTTPNYSNAYNRVYNALTQSYEYVQTENFQSLGSLALSQNIGPTGGSISLQSDLTYEKDYTKGKEQFVSVPTSIRLVQPILQYNDLKWNKKIEPVRFEAAKKTFLSSIETVHQTAVMNFFSLALAQINQQIAEMNYSNADTLYRIANGRYELGTISEDELLQMQLSWLNAETERKSAAMNLRDREIRLRSFLGFNDQVRLELILPNSIPQLQVSPQEVFDLAMQNNPEILQQKLTVLQAQSSVAQAKAQRGLNANIIANFGLQGRQENIEDAYRYDYLNRNQGVRVSFSLPILDWGLGRGRFKMAQSSLELAQVQSQQAITDFEQNLYLDVEQFNLQSYQVATAAKSDTVAMRRYEVTKQRFLIGKIAVLDLNDADTRKDQNRRAYVQALQSYWNYFYNLRALTLYDFINRKPIETDYEQLVQ